MRRNDYQRRLLRDMYDRNVRRTHALAEARDRRRSNDDELMAPRRYIVTERRTRLAGFGRGGYQVRDSRRGRGAGGERRFRDKTIFRRGGADRFRRDDDVTREVRRERFQSRQGGPHVGRLRRLRRRLRERLQRVERLERQETRGQAGRRNGGRRRGNLDNELERYQSGRGGGRGGRGGGRGGNGGGRGKQGGNVTKEGLDAELERFRGGN